MDKDQLTLLGQALYEQARVNIEVVRSLLLIVREIESIKGDSAALRQIDLLVDIAETQTKSAEAWVDAVGLTNKSTTGEEA